MVLVRNWGPAVPKAQTPFAAGTLTLSSYGGLREKGLTKAVIFGRHLAQRKWKDRSPWEQFVQIYKNDKVNGAATLPEPRNPVEAMCYASCLGTKAFGFRTSTANRKLHGLGQPAGALIRRHFP